MSFTIDTLFENFDVFNDLYSFEKEFKNKTSVKFDKHSILSITKKKLLKIFKNS